MKRIILLAVLALSGAAFAAGASKSRGGKRGPIYITQYHTKGTINQRGRGQNPGASQRRGQQTHSRYRSSSKGRAAGLSKGSRSNAGARAKRK